MEMNWSTVRGRGRASRIAQRGDIRGGVSSRLNLDAGQVETRRGQNFNGRSNSRFGFPGGRGRESRGQMSRGGPRQAPGGAARRQGQGQGSRGPQQPAIGGVHGPQGLVTFAVIAQLASSLKTLQDGLSAIGQQFNSLTRNQPWTGLMNNNGPTVSNGPNNNNGPLVDNGPMTDNGPRNPGIHHDNRSGNLDFSNLCKTTFRYVQVSHHMENWQNVPASIGRNIGTLISNIKPPMPCSELTDKLTAIGVDFGNKIAETVKSHLQTVKVNVESSLLRLDNQDADKAHAIVKKQLNYKLGRKMAARDQERWLSEARGLTDVQQSTGNVNQPPQPILGTQVPSQPIQGSQVSKTTSNVSHATAVSGSTPSKKREADNSPQPGKSKQPGKSHSNEPDSSSSDDEMQSNEMQSDEGGTTDIEEYSDLDVTMISKPTMQTRSNCASPNVTVHSKDYNKSYFTTKISVKPSCRVLVVGDSQLQNLVLPEHFQIDSFRGGKFPHITDAVKGLELPDQVEDIVVAAGINHRDVNLDKETMPTLTTCIAALRRTGRRIHFLEVSIPNSFSEVQRGRMEAVNEYVRSRPMDLRYIGACPREKVTTGADGLHYGKTTLAIIAGKITDHFLN